ncbi:MAG: hypothetical protein WCN95_15000 [bacterium]
MNIVREKVCAGVVLFLITAAPALCNTDSRYWTLATGTTFHAELVSYSISNDVAVLLFNDVEKKTYSIKDFSAIDAAWLYEWAEVSEDLDEMLKTVKGEFNHYQYRGKSTNDFYVYTPGRYRQTKKLPMMILFDCSGKGARYVKRYIDAAEALDLIVVCSDSFRNTGAVSNEKDDIMFHSFEEWLPTLERTVPHDSSRLYMGGSSGGAMRAYQYSASVDRPWAGIFANGGWLGGPKYYNLPYREGMRVVMVNGHNDAANIWLKSDSAALEKRNCIVNTYAFEGGHQLPPASVQFKALKWLIQSDNEAPPEKPEGPKP